MRAEMKMKEEMEEQIDRMMKGYRKKGKITAVTEYKKFEEIAKNDSQFLKLLNFNKQKVLLEFLNQVKKAKDKVKSVQVKDFKKMLSEIEKNTITETTNWSEMKLSFRSDPRYKAVSSKSQREKLFTEFVAEVLEERNAKLELQHKRDKPEEKKTVNTEEQRRHNEKLFMEILSDYIKQPNLTWFDAVKLIEKDKRYGELSSYTATMPYAYGTYIKNYKQKLYNDYKDLLKERSEITYKSTFEECKRYLESDDRYVALSRHAREDIFERHVKELIDNVKTYFKQMMRESNYITKDSQTEGQAFDDLVKVLRMADARFRRMDSWPEERDFLLKEYITKLKGSKRKH